MQNLLLFKSNSGFFCDYFKQVEFFILRKRLTFNCQIDEIVNRLIVDLSEVFADAFIELQILMLAETGLNCIWFSPLEYSFQG